MTVQRQMLSTMLCAALMSSQAAASPTLTCTMLEWHGRDLAIVQSWLGEELRVSFADQQLHIRHGNEWYTDISFTAQTNGADERRISFQQRGTYHGERHTIDFSYVLNGNGTVNGYATSISLGTITANGTCFIMHDGVS